MKKSDIIKTLEKLKSRFGASNINEEALPLFDKLIELSIGAEFQSQPAKELADQPLTLPSELLNQKSGFAVFSDGACRGNPGPGAWAVVVQDITGAVILKSSGVDLPTTNNKMELEGVIRGLKGLVEKWVDEGFSDNETPVYVYSDSKYVTEGIEKWVPGWKERGWKKADNKEPENLLLWKELDQLKSRFNHIYFIWVKGHAGHPQNELCDRMCNLALDEAGF